MTNIKVTVQFSQTLFYSILHIASTVSSWPWIFKAIVVHAFWCISFACMRKWYICRIRFCVRSEKALTTQPTWNRMYCRLEILLTLSLLSTMYKSAMWYVTTIKNSARSMNKPQGWMHKGVVKMVWSLTRSMRNSSSNNRKDSFTCSVQ